MEGIIARRLAVIMILDEENLRKVRLVLDHSVGPKGEMTGDGLQRRPEIPSGQELRARLENRLEDVLETIPENHSGIGEKVLEASPDQEAETELVLQGSGGRDPQQGTSGGVGTDRGTRETGVGQNVKGGFP